MSKQYKYIELVNIENYKDWDLIEIIPAKFEDYHDMCVICFDDTAQEEKAQYTDTINRLQAEKEALTNGQETLQKHIAEQKAEIKLLKAHSEMADGYADAVEQNAIKEFAERLKKNRIAVDVSFDYGREHYIDAVPIIEIDNLVKEMTEVSP